MATLIKADGTLAPVWPAVGPYFTLDELHKLVGGYIEIVGIRPGHYGLIAVQPGEFLVVNEEGLLHGLTPNRTATQMYGRRNRMIVGDVVLTSRKEIE